jgi:hypothetical protein
LSRTPEAVSQFQARRVGSDVYLTLVVPAHNIDGSPPARTMRVDVYAVTTSGPPPRGPFAATATRVASVQVVQPPPPSPGAKPTPPTDVPASPAPGDAIAIRETLGAAELVPKPTAESALDAAPKPAEPNDQAPPVASTSGPRRHYMAVAFGARDESLGSGPLTSVPAGPLPPAPDDVKATYTEQQLTVTWTTIPASTYHVYRDDGPASSSNAPAWGMAAPASVNGAPLSTPMYSEPVEFGRERCFRVRTLTMQSGVTVEGEASARACVTPDDHFPPAPPEGLRALTAPEGVTLRWVPNSESDLGGYLVLRGRAGDATLQTLTASPIAQTQYLDRDVQSGVRYVYAIVAVDTHKPAPNRSEPSARDEAMGP